MRGRVPRVWRTLASKKEGLPAQRTAAEAGEKRGHTALLRTPIVPSVLIVPPHFWRWPRRDDDPRMIGDYPAPPLLSAQLRDPRAFSWGDAQVRRAAGEAVPEDHDGLSVWAPDVPAARYDWRWLVAGPAVLAGVVGGLWALGTLVPSPMPHYALRELPYAVPRLHGSQVAPRKRL